MHIPDHLLSTPVTVATYVSAAVLVGTSLWQTLRRKPSSGRLGLAALATAAVFAAQAFNIPLAPEYSGHLVGAALLTILFGPWLATLSLSLILALQAFLLGDGGNAALGANILIMGVAGSWFAWLLWRGLGPQDSTPAQVPAGPRSLGLSLAVSLFSVLASALVLWVISAHAAGQSASSYLALLLQAHLRCGLLEGFLTAGIFLLLQMRLRPSPVATQAISWAVLVVVFGLLAMASSPLPDGFEWSLHGPS